MPGPPAAVAAVRRSITAALRAHHLAGAHLLLGVSGGPDSLALAAGAGHAVPALGGTVGALVVDHGLQEHSAAVAEEAAAQCRTLGLDPVAVRRVQVASGSGEGPEAAARRARLAALHDRAVEVGAAAVLLGHTLDDQAEQVLLGLARGSGSRSLAGMPAARPIQPGSPVLLLRPLLDHPRQTTEAACAAVGLTPWHDPHNADPTYTRVRVRGAIAQLQDALGPGLPAALARTADLLRDDAEALDEGALSLLDRHGPPPWSVTEVLAAPVALRRRFWRTWALRLGSPGGALSSTHLREVDALLTHWHGQGPIHLPGGVRAGRSGDRVWLDGPTDS